MDIRALIAVICLVGCSPAVTRQADPLPVVNAAVVPVNFLPFSIADIAGKCGLALADAGAVADGKRWLFRDLGLSRGQQRSIEAFGLDESRLTRLVITSRVGRVDDTELDIVLVFSDVANLLPDGVDRFPFEKWLETMPILPASVSMADMDLQLSLVDRAAVLTVSPKKLPFENHLQNSMIEE